MASRHRPHNPVLIDDDGAEYTGSTRCAAGCQPPTWPCDAAVLEERLRSLERAVCTALHLKRVHYEPDGIMAEFFGGTTYPLAEVHSDYIDRGTDART